MNAAERRYLEAWTRLHQPTPPERWSDEALVDTFAVLPAPAVPLAQFLARVGAEAAPEGPPPAAEPGLAPDGTPLTQAQSDRLIAALKRSGARLGVVHDPNDPAVLAARERARVQTPAPAPATAAEPEPIDAPPAAQEP